MAPTPKRRRVAAIPLGRTSRFASRNQPGRQTGNSPEGHPSRRPYSVLLPVGFTVPPLLPGARWALTPPFHPCHAGMAEPSQPGGLLSVALSLGSPPPAVSRHRVSMEPGLSSPAAFRLSRVRPPGQLAPRIKALAEQIATAKIGLVGSISSPGEARSRAAGASVSSVDLSATPSTRRGAEMALEGFDHDAGLEVEDAVDLDAIAVEPQHRLQPLDSGSAVALGDEAASSARGRRRRSGRCPRRPAHPTETARPDRSCGPAPCRNAQAPARRGIAWRRDDAAAKRDDGVDLARSENRGSRASVRDWRPRCRSSWELMSVWPRQELLPACQARSAFADHLHDAAVLMDEIVRRDLAHRIAQPAPRPLPPVSMPV